MDLNYLYSRHQISIMRADAAESPEARRSHNGLAVGYAREIQRKRLIAGGGDHITTFG